VRLAAEALEPDQLDLLAAFESAKEPWVRRAAIGAALGMEPTPAALAAARRDFDRFLAAPLPEVALPSGARLSPLHLFLESYADVERAAVVRRDAERCAEYLPLYRALVDHVGVVDPFRNERTFYRERIGLAGLAIAGTEEDLARLYAFTRSETPATRQRALDAIARILGLERVPTDASEFAAREPEIVEATRAALAERGFDAGTKEEATETPAADPKKLERR
jgi:hypothetical protein